MAAAGLTLTAAVFRREERTAERRDHVLCDCPEVPLYGHLVSLENVPNDVLILLCQIGPLPVLLSS
jgi:hypothetical protein